MQIKHILKEQTPPAVQPAAAAPAAPDPAAPAQQAAPGAVKNVQQAATQTRGQQTQGQLNVQALKQLLPGVDGTKLSQAMLAVKSGAMTAAHYQILGMAFQQLVQADPATTVKVMNVLKRVQQEPVAEAGVLDYAKAIGSKMTGGAQGQTIGQAATASATNRAGSAAQSQANALAMATVKNWNNKAALLRQQALAGGTTPANPAAPIDPKIYKANLEDFVDRVMFKGDMDYLDDTSKKQITADIDALVLVQGDQAKTNTGFKKLALSALTSRTTKPGTPAQAADTTGQQTQHTAQSVEAELAAQGVKLPSINTLKSALSVPHIRATGDPRADALLTRFGYDPR
jgi:hypothetical protein